MRRRQASSYSPMLESRTMNERSALASLPRTESTIERELEGQRLIVEMHRRMAGEFWTLDLRPLIFSNEGVARLGPPPVPPSLLEALARETTRLAELEHELY